MDLKVGENFDEYFIWHLHLPGCHDFVTGVSSVSCVIILLSALITFHFDLNRTV